MQVYAVLKMTPKSQWHIITTLFLSHINSTVGPDSSPVLHIAFQAALNLWNLPY